MLINSAYYLFNSVNRSCAVPLKHVWFPSAVYDKQCAVTYSKYDMCTATWELL